MTDSNVLQRAREGNPDAIAVLMNHSLKSKGMHAAVQRAGDRLLVNLETATPPDQAVLTKFVNQGVRSLNLENIDTVIVSGRQQGGDRPAWTSTLHLKSDTPHAPLPPLAPRASAPQANAPTPSPPPVPPRHSAAPPPPPPLTRTGAASPISAPGVPPAPDDQTIRNIDDESFSIAQKSTVDEPNTEVANADAGYADAPQTTLQEAESTITLQEPREPSGFRDGTAVAGLSESLGLSVDNSEARQSPLEGIAEDQSSLLYEYDVYADDESVSRETDGGGDRSEQFDSQAPTLTSSNVESSTSDQSGFESPSDSEEGTRLKASVDALPPSMPDIPVIEESGDADGVLPDTPAAPPAPPQRRSANPLVLVSVVVVILGAVGGLIGYSLWSYFSNGGSILDPGITPTPTMPENTGAADDASTGLSGEGTGEGDAISVDADALLLEAEEKAESARTLAQTAQSGDDWDLVVRQWERAIALTEEIPETDSQYSLAQQQLADYRTNLAAAQQQAEARANVDSTPLPSTVVTVNEEQVQCLDIAATAESQPVELTNVQFYTTSNEGTTNQIVGCITNHSDQAIASATIGYSGAPADAPDSTVEGRGELDFADLQPGATVAFRGNFELPSSLNTVEIAEISWLPIGSTEPQSIETSLALSNN